MRHRSSCLSLASSAMLATFSSLALAQSAEVAPIAEVPKVDAEREGGGDKPSIPPTDPSTAPPVPPAAPSTPLEGSPPSDAPAAEQSGDDANAEADEESPSRAPKKGMGAVWGVVTSGLSKETLIEAAVTVAGRKTRALTDVDGRFRIELPPGKYDLRVAYELHKAQRLQNIEVKAGEVVRFDVVLEADKAAEEEVSAIEIDAERGNTATQLLLRRQAATASDGIGAQEIAKTPDRNAAEAAKRVVGATIVDSRYVYVRGLGERYTNSLLNGAPLPSPEPDRQAVPLDVFPSVLLSDLTIVKTFTPDMPGDFAGGSVVIHTRDFPQKFTFNASLNAGLNSESSLASRLSLPNTGRYDWLGFDDGTRALPSGFPSGRLVEIDPNTGDRQDLTPYGRAINTPMAPKRSMSPPNFGGNVVIGDSFRLGAAKRHEIGYQSAASYSATYLRRVDELLRTFAPANEPGGSIRLLNDYRGETGIQRTQWSAFGSTSYGYGSDHRLTVSGLYTRTGESEVRQFRGFNEERDSDIEDTRMRFVGRGLAFGQLRGEHKFPMLGKSQLTWTGTVARASLTDPDFRNNVYTFDPQSKQRVWEETPLSGLHFFADQGERTLGLNADYLQPIVEGDKPTNVKVGGLLIRRRRDFTARRFVFRRNPSADPVVFQQDASALFTDANIGPALTLEEQTRGDDAYKADYDVSSAYAMGDIALHEKLRFVAGARLEVGTQTIDSFDQFSPDNRRIRSTLERADVLPSANVIVKANDKTNVRLSVSQTVARPQLRELAPFMFTDYFGGRDVQGNPNLDRTRIWNADARYEFFPSTSEVIAVSVFYKRFIKPIEPVILQSSRGLLTFDNAAGADNLGAEFEVRKSLGFLMPSSPFLRDLTGVANFTAVHSVVDLGEGTGIQSSTRRPLANQSPYIANLALDYQAEATGTRVRALYNVYGARIAQVGAFGLPDVYEQPRHLVDVTVAQRVGKGVDLRFTVSDLFNAPFRFTHGEANADASLTNRYRVGTTGTFFVTWTGD